MLARGSDRIDKITTFFLVNLLWAVFAAPIITFPAATAGLFATLTPWVRGEPSELFKDFFGGMRRYWWKSTIIGLIDLALVGLIVLNLTILDAMQVTSVLTLFSRNVAFLVAALAVATNLYVWPLLVTLDLPLKQLIKVALRLVFLEPLWSIFATILMLSPLLLALFLPRFAAVLLAFACSALLASWGAWHVIEKYKRDLLV